MNDQKFDAEAALERLRQAGGQSDREQYLSVARQAAREDGQFVWGEVVYKPGVTQQAAIAAARRRNGSEAELVDWRFTPERMRAVVGGAVCGVRE